MDGTWIFIKIQQLEFEDLEWVFYGRGAVQFMDNKNVLL